MSRELTEDEEFFIQQKLRNKQVEFNDEDDVYVKVKEPPTALKKTLWTILRPRNWAVLLGVVGVIIVYLAIYTINKINELIQEGLVPMVEGSPYTMKQVLEQMGVAPDQVDKFLVFYNNYPIIIAGIVVVFIIVIAILLMLDYWMNNRRSKNETE